MYSASTSIVVLFCLSCIFLNGFIFCWFTDQFCIRLSQLFTDLEDPGGCDALLNPLCASLSVAVLGTEGPGAEIICGAFV